MKNNKWNWTFIESDGRIYGQLGVILYCFNLISCFESKFIFDLHK